MTEVNAQIINNQEVNSLKFSDTFLSDKELKDPLIKADQLPDVNLPDSKKIHIQDIEGFFDNISNVPDNTPKKFWDSFKIYNGTLYFYDPQSRTWKTPISTLGAPLIGYGYGTSSGTYPITGIGFTPSYVRITAYPDGTPDALYAQSLGGSTSLGVNTVFHYYDGARIQTGTDNSTIICLYDDSGGTTKALAEFVSFDADGFTIDITQLDFNFTFLYECYI